MATIDSLTSQIRALYEKADEDERRRIQEELRDTQLSFDTDWDVVVRVGAGALQISLVKIGDDLDLFKMLASSSTPVSLNDIVSKTGAAPKLLSHILRAMSSFGLITQVSPSTFAANKSTRAFADENVSGAMEHAFDVHSPVAHALPAWLKEKKYQNITTNKDLPFHKALNTDKEPFEWMKLHPEQMKSLGHAMAIQREGHWIDSYPVPAEVGNFTPGTESALLVDIGGGFGQQSIAFKEKFPELKGRVVVQDIPETLNSAPKNAAVEFQVHDFFTEQPIKGAKFYYIRQILHDWTDDDSIRILKAILPAMGPESRLVIDEVVLPDEKLPWQAAYMDLTMMACLGGVERTRAEYETLLESAGFKVSNVHKYDAKMQSVVIAIPK